MKSNLLAPLFLLLPLLITAQNIHWQTDLDQALSLSSVTGKSVFVFYTGKYCPPCQNMKKGLFKMHDVIDYLNENYIPLQADVYKHTEMSLPQFMVLNQNAGRQWEWAGTISSERLIEELENTVLGTPKSTKRYLIQFGAFSQLANAKRLHKKLHQKYGAQVKITKKGTYNVVQMTGFARYTSLSPPSKKPVKTVLKGELNNILLTNGQQ